MHALPDFPGQPLQDPESMQAALQALLPRFGQIRWIWQTGSSNADLLALARQQTDARPWLLGTHLQQQGRGRAGRHWHNRAGAHLMFSCAFDVYIQARQLPATVPLIGMATCLALREHISDGNKPRLSTKWPNDILWDGRKLAGILIESTRAGTTAAANHHLLIVGLGLNLLDAETLSADLQRPVCDWRMIATADAKAARTPIEKLVSDCAVAWSTSLAQASDRGFAELPALYARTDGLAGKFVDLLEEGDRRPGGIACGIDSQGRLMLRKGTLKHVVSMGDVSIRLSTDESKEQP